VANTGLAHPQGGPDARTMPDEPSSSTRVSLGAAPKADPRDLGHKLSKQSIREALFPEVGSERVFVGRFELLRRLGRGGMGEVYVAYDAQLDREVALKLLLPERSPDDHARERLLREAQVLARLSHPNVVQIHEAGIHDEQVYLVMELVDGVTLREWLEQRPAGATVRPRAEVLPVMIAAGQGLAAAHAAGLTHRDFKPDNVLVGRDGRVRVLDFGLARPADELADETSDVLGPISLDDPTATEPGSSRRGPSPGSSQGSSSRRGIAHLTVPGAIMGTLAYMSPEQLTAAPLDPRSDQFSFCVALYEALYGCRPFRGRTIGAVMLAIVEGTPELPGDPPRVPRWLRALVHRGLAARPEQRFTDMDALLRELSGPHGRAPRIAAVASGLVLTGVAMGSMLSSAEPPCALADAELAAGWDEPAREAVRAAFGAVAPAYGTETAARVIAVLDPRVEAWRDEQRDACEDTRVRQTHAEEQLARRMACIERNTTLLRALLDALPEADAELVEHAMDAAVTLPEPARCQDLDALGPDAPADPATVQAMRDDVARAQLTRLAGREAEARAEADALLVRAEAAAYAPVHAEALLEAARGRMASPRHDDLERAAEMLWQALDLAEAHGDHAQRFEIWSELLDVDRGLGHHDRARLWFRRAEVALERSPGEPARHPALALRRGVLELHAGDVEASERWLRRGLTECEAQPGTEQLKAQLFEALGNTLRRSARGGEARQAFEQAEVRWQAHLGAEHPYLARHAFNLGLLLAELGELDAARERLEHARARWTELYGPEASLVGRAELALADLAQAEGSLDDALAHVTRGREILAATLPVDDPVRVEALQMLGLVQFRRGELQAAHDAWLETAERLLATRPASDPDVLLTRSNIAEALLGLHRHDEARAIYAALLPVVEAQSPQDPLVLMLVLKGLGLAELGAGHHAEAAARLRAALALLDRHPSAALERADVQWALARAEHETDGPSAAPRERAEAAARLYAEHGQAARAAEIRAWLVDPVQ